MITGKLDRRHFDLARLRAAAPAAWWIAGRRGVGFNRPQGGGASVGAAKIPTSSVEMLSLRKIWGIIRARHRLAKLGKALKAKHKQRRRDPDRPGPGSGSSGAAGCQIDRLPLDRDPDQNWDGSGEEARDGGDISRSHPLDPSGEGIGVSVFSPARSSRMGRRLAKSVARLLAKLHEEICRKALGG